MNFTTFSSIIMLALAVSIIYGLFSLYDNMVSSKNHTKEANQACQHTVYFGEYRACMKAQGAEGFK